MLPEGPSLRHRRKNISLFSVVGLLAVCLYGPSAQSQVVDGAPSAETPDHSFTVKQSIQLTRFERTGAAPQFSPDGRYFAVVTSRGILQSDRIESTLRVFRVQEVIQYINSDRSQQPRARTVAKVSVTPQAEYNNSYEPTISGVRWLPDSPSILFLAQNSRGNRQLRRVSLDTRLVQPLTPEDHDVSQFDSNGDTTIYRRTKQIVSPRGVQINADARNVTGVPLTQILFPQLQTRPKVSDLWTIHGRRVASVINTATHRPINLSDLPPPIPEWSPLSLSPDGKWVVVLSPVRSIPKTWETYEPTLEMWRLRADTSGLPQDSIPVTPTQYVVINLTNNAVVPLVNAPNAYLLGYTSRNLAKWSLDGTTLLITNTYLPFSTPDDSGHDDSLRPCAALVISFVSKRSDCVAYDRGENDPLLDASISNPREVFLHFASTQRGEHFQYLKGAWKTVPPTQGKVIQESSAVGATSYNSSSSTALSVDIRQDLNTPPTLWATDRESGRSRQIWDPNSQLVELTLGQATPYSWTDKTGYQWRGALVRPPKYEPGQRYPLVIQTHGFEEDEFMTDGAYTTAFCARPLAALGIMVLQMADRFDDMDRADEASNRILAFQSAIDSLASAGFIDRAKVGIIGFSRTSYYVEAALVKAPDLFVAATIADGVDESYMQYLFSAVGEPTRESEEFYGGKPFGDGLQRWLNSAPGFHLDRLQTPLRIEAITPRSILSEWEIYASLWKQAKAADLIYIPNGQHILQKPLERMASQQGNVDWFRFWLKGEEDPDPAKAEQYARWKGLANLLKRKQNPD
jgi:dipeptidyl aminopeptidase/acylaminoacyl peptidase